MHLSTNVSHWVCVLAGLLLVATGAASHAIRSAALGARTGAAQHDYPGMIRRTVLIGIGLAAIAYGVSRMVVLW